MGPITQKSPFPPLDYRKVACIIGDIVEGQVVTEVATTNTLDWLRVDEIARGKAYDVRRKFHQLQPAQVISYLQQSWSSKRSLKLYLTTKLAPPRFMYSYFS